MSLGSGAKSTLFHINVDVIEKLFTLTMLESVLVSEQIEKFCLQLCATMHSIVLCGCREVILAKTVANKVPRFSGQEPELDRQYHISNFKQSCQ